MRGDVIINKLEVRGDPHALKIGRIVHYHMQDRHLPAVVVGIDVHQAGVLLRLHILGIDDDFPVLKTCIHDDATDYGWHWPDECPEGL